MIVVVYIDDLILGSKSLKALEWLKDQLMKEFSMKDLGEAKTIIRWQIIHKEGIFKIDQKGYVWDLLKSEGMTSCHPTILQ